jgi:hypothetical protein
MNVTGWNELISGNLISAAFIMFDTAFGGWVVVILFMVYQFMLYMKTRNAALSWITGVLFTAMFAASTIMSASGVPVFKPIALQILFLILVLELAGILYIMLWK